MKVYGTWLVVVVVFIVQSKMSVIIPNFEKVKNKKGEIWLLDIMFVGGILSLLSMSMTFSNYSQATVINVLLLRIFSG